jgi:hypothetical protein
MRAILPLMLMSCNGENVSSGSSDTLDRRRPIISRVIQVKIKFSDIENRVKKYAIKEKFAFRVDDSVRFIQLYRDDVKVFLAQPMDSENVTLSIFPTSACSAYPKSTLEEAGMHVTDELVADLTR